MVKTIEKIEDEEETKEETVKETKPEVKAVSLVEVPTQFGLAYSTPEGNMSQDQYLVWLGNMFLDFKAAIAGN